MSPLSTVSLHATDVGLIADVLPGLRARLNRPMEPTTTFIAEANVLRFTANTRQPLLRVCVEDALDGLLGDEWRAAFDWYAP